MRSSKVFTLAAAAAVLMVGLGSPGSARAQIAPGSTYLVFLPELAVQDCWRFNADGSFSSDILTNQQGFAPGQWHSAGVNMTAFTTRLVDGFTVSAGGLAFPTFIFGVEVQSDASRSGLFGLLAPNCTVPPPPAQGGTGP